MKLEDAGGGSLVTLLCPTVCDPMDYSPPGSSVHGISQARNTAAGYHFLFPQDLADPGIKSMSPALQAYSLPPSHWGNTLEDAKLSETGRSQGDSHTV